MASPAEKRIGEAPPAARKRGRPADRDSRDTRAAILQVALRYFGNAGYRDVSLTTIAAECLVDKRTITYHFGSKRGLYEAAMDEAFGRFVHEVRASVFSHDTARARVAAYIDVYRSLYASDPDVVRFIGTALPAGLATTENQEALVRAGADLLQLLVQLVDDAIAAGELSPQVDRRGAVQLLSAVSMGMSLMSMADPEPYPATLDALEQLVAGTFFAPPD